MLNKLYRYLQKVRHARRFHLWGFLLFQPSATVTGGEQHKRTLLQGRYGAYYPTLDDRLLITLIT
jgi:hypothetical protein